MLRHSWSDVWTWWQQQNCWQHPQHLGRRCSFYRFYMRVQWFRCCRDIPAEHKYIGRTEWPLTALVADIMSSLLKMFASSFSSLLKMFARLWSALPPIDLNLSFTPIKLYLKLFLWNHFVSNFNPNNSCTLHFLCPCFNTWVMAVSLKLSDPQYINHPFFRTPNALHIHTRVVKHYYYYYY